MHSPRSVRADRTQTFFLDFDGASLDPAIFAGAGLPPIDPPGPRTFALLASFLPAWKLTGADQKPLEEAIRRAVRTKLEAVRPGLAVNVVGSDNSPDLFGRPDVTRVIVGGTIKDTGLPTIGIAQSIDPGNFDTSETAVVLLDKLSAPGETEPRSPNAFLTSASNRIEYLGAVLGNVVAHEPGHLLGNWHTEPTAGVFGVMDTSPRKFAEFIAGPDRVGGTADDRTKFFAPANAYETGSGVQGIQDTRYRVAVALSR